jgi:CRISPR-associated protein (TIGR02710 family)
MADLLMLSVGGSPQPLRTAIEGGCWGRLHFIVSAAEAGTASSRDMVEGQQINYAQRGETPRPGPGLRYLMAPPAGIAITEVPPDNLDRALSVIDAALAAEIAAGHRVTVDYTGGTKTMTAALVLAATGHEGTALQFMSGQRPDLRQVVPGSEKAVEMPGELLGLARLFAAARAFVARRNYGAALDVIGDVKLTMSRLRGLRAPRSWNLRIERWRAWLTVMHEWDRFGHAAALNHWRNAHESGEAWADTFAAEGFAGRLGSLAKAGNHPTPELLEDLWLNAERRANLGQYDDAVARLYRLAEACVQCRLWTEHRIDTGNVDPAQLSEEERLRAQPRRDRDGRDYYVLALTDALRLLGRKTPQDPVVACWPVDGAGAFANPDWQGSRNHSILAHGFRPLGEQDWKAAVRWFKQRRAALWEQALGRPTGGQLPNVLPAPTAAS